MFLDSFFHDHYGREIFHNGKVFEEVTTDNGSPGYLIAKAAYEDEKALHAEGKCCQTDYSNLLIKS